MVAVSSPVWSTRFNFEKTLPLICDHKYLSSDLPETDIGPKYNMRLPHPAHTPCTLNFLPDSFLSKLNKKLAEPKVSLFLIFSLWDSLLN